MKLKCKTHNRRVIILKSRTVVHRNDGSNCPDQILKMGDNIDVDNRDYRGILVVPANPNIPARIIIP